jgi:hypothetical protein
MVESASDTAFESACGEFTFAAEFGGKWRLQLKERTPADETGVADSLFDRIVVDYCNDFSDVDHCNSTVSSVCTPSVLRILPGVTNRPQCSWSEHVVRRYALIVKLFGETAADTGQFLLNISSPNYSMHVPCVATAFNILRNLQLLYELLLDLPNQNKY